MGDLNKFQQYQMGQAMTMAAENPSGGGAADGMGMGLGFAMASRMMQPGMGGTAAGGMAPPPINAGTWHVAVNGQTTGPYTADQLAAGAAAGQLTPQSMVWSAGMSGWQAAGQVPQLAAVFGPPTPPPPPAP